MNIFSFPLKTFSSFKFRILILITVNCRFAHSFKIMPIPQPAIPFVVFQHPVQAIRSSIGDEIDIAYIRCLDGRVPEAFELWVFSEDIVREV